MSIAPIAERLIALPGGRDAYVNSAFFRAVVSMVRATERDGRDGVDALGTILIGLSVARDQLTKDAIDRLMRAPGTP